MAGVDETMGQGREDMLQLCIAGAIDQGGHRALSGEVLKKLAGQYATDACGRPSQQQVDNRCALNMMGLLKADYAPTIAIGLQPPCLHPLLPGAGVFPSVAKAQVCSAYLPVIDERSQCRQQWAGILLVGVEGAGVGDGELLGPGLVVGRKPGVADAVAQHLYRRAELGQLLLQPLRNRGEQVCLCQNAPVGAQLQAGPKGIGVAGVYMQVSEIGRPDQVGVAALEQVGNAMVCIRPESREQVGNALGFYQLAAFLVAFPDVPGTAVAGQEVEGEAVEQALCTPYAPMFFQLPRKIGAVVFPHAGQQPAGIPSGHFMDVRTAGL